MSIRILGDGFSGLLVDEMSGHVDLAESELVVVLVVQNVHEIGVERVDLFDLGKLVEYERQAVVETLLREFHLAHVERAYARDLVVFVHDGGRFALRFRQDHIDELLGRGDGRHFFKIVM